MSKKDMRRADLGNQSVPAGLFKPRLSDQNWGLITDIPAVVPYVEPKNDEKSADLTSTFATTMPMVAMFTRNRLLGWTSFVMAILNWLSESPDASAKGATPGYLSVGMSFVAVLVTYLPLFLPPPINIRGGTRTEAPAPVAP